MEQLVIKGAPSFAGLLNPISFGAAINPGIPAPVPTATKAADGEINFQEEEEVERKKRRLNDQFQEEYNKKQKVLHNAIPTLDNSPEWTKVYKKVCGILEEKEWREKILKDWGGKFPEVERLDLDTLKMIETKMWSILTMSHPFEGQWELAKIGIYGAEQIALSYGLKQYSGVTSKLTADPVLYLEAKKWSLQYFEYGNSMHWFQILARIYKDVMEVTTSNLKQLELAHSMLSLPANAEALRLYKEFNS